VGGDDAVGTLRAAVRIEVVAEKHAAITRGGTASRSSKRSDINNLWLKLVSMHPPK
jgi:hypothetical protein